jgi:hypothetical protein
MYYKKQSLILFFVLLCTLPYANMAQSPESGSFWSLSYREFTFDTISNKFETMGFVEVPTGKHLFEFSKSLVKFYVGGNMGNNYKEKYEYRVVNRELDTTTSDFASYVYVVVGNKNNLIQISINVMLKDYDQAIVTVYDDYIKEENRFNGFTEYLCIRQH